MITIDGSYRLAAARLLAASACLLAFTMGAARAQVSQAEISAVKANCRSNYMAHCMSVRPGGKEALQCLQSHLDSLTGACKSAVAATMPKPAPPPAAAAPPPPPPPHKAAKAPPPPPPPHKAAKAPPPPAHEEPPPQAAAAPPPPSAAAIKEAMRQHCRADYMELCRRVPPGGKEALQCMQRHYASLSPRCKTAVAPNHAHGAAQGGAPPHARADARAHARRAPAGRRRATPAAGAGPERGDGARRRTAVAGTHAHLPRLQPGSGRSLPGHAARRRPHHRLPGIASRRAVAVLCAGGGTGNAVGAGARPDCKCAAAKPRI